jgi:hypothetical protein
MIRWHPTTFGIAFQRPIAGTRQGIPAQPAAGLYDEQEQLIESSWPVITVAVRGRGRRQ